MEWEWAVRNPVRCLRVEKWGTRNRNGEGGIETGISKCMSNIYRNIVVQQHDIFLGANELQWVPKMTKATKVCVLPLHICSFEQHLQQTQTKFSPS